KVFTMAAAGNLPDVMLTADIYTAPFVDAGVLMDMQPFADADEEINFEDTYPSIMGLGRVEGDPGLYMIPVSLDNVQVYYNKTMWEASGAPMPTPEWTWEDLIASCKLVQEANPDVHCIGIGGAAGGGGFSWWAYIVPWIRGYGGDVLSEDSSTSTLSTPESLAGIQAYANLWVEHEVAIPLGSDLGGNCFINQRCATWLSIPIFAGIFRDGIAGAFDWDVEVIPSHPQGRFTGMGTFGYAVSSGTKYPDEAWDFVKVLLTPEGQERMLRTYRAAPLLKSLAESEVFNELEPPPANFRRVFVEGQQYGILPRTYPVECGSLYTGQVEAAIRNGLEQVIRGQGTAEQIFPGVDAEIQACLDRAAAN
ncbi:MAG TPA: sugar ABC transporter substrate-binding protein, partial [Caldilineaceae bacterium]|nr:sugar ABC transporter substrate-binding protein [Caldilineaceae bacterium]